jgi:hypothetical protein
LNILNSIFETAGDVSAFNQSYQYNDDQQIVNLSKEEYLRNYLLK